MNHYEVTVFESFLDDGFIFIFTDGCLCIHNFFASFPPHPL